MRHDDALTAIWSELGIPPDFGTHTPLPRHLETAELVEVEPNIVGRMQHLAPDTAAAWRQMKRAALREGIELLLVSGFRSVSRQIELIRSKLAAGQTIEKILKVNAPPGYSEHHTGHAIDIATPGARPLTAEFTTTTAYAWLTANAARFGFQQPYGPDNRFGLDHEPWHWSRLALPIAKPEGVPVAERR